MADTVKTPNVIAHTPGPWKSSLVRKMADNPENNAFAVYGPEGDAIALCNGVVSPNEVNAQIIAAAPELLAACKESLNAFKAIRQHILPLVQGQSRNFGEEVSALIEAIAKAEGRL